MQINYSAFILPHVGDLYSQCADRFSCGEANNCFAIADGVGNSLFPGEWATILCEDYIKHPDIFSSDSKLVREEELIKQWEQQRDERVSNLNDDERFIYEMGLDKADFAAATFVGLSLDKKGWKCQAIGDSYLFIIDKSFEIIEKVASMDGHEFDNFPEYLASKKGQDNGTIIERSGSYDNVAFFVLMTDALSDWFIETTPEKRKNLLCIKNHSDFESIIDKERQQLALKDDDTTILFLKIYEDDNKEITFYSSPEQVDNIQSLISKEKNDAINSSETDMDDKENQNGLSDLGSKSKCPYDIDESSTSIASPNKITQEIDKISKNYQTYSKKQLKRCVNKLLSYIKHLSKYGTSN